LRSTAEYSLTGTFTSPNETVPFHSERGGMVVRYPPAGGGTRSLR
jgi:hypothetical protein